MSGHQIRDLAFSATDLFVVVNLDGVITFADGDASLLNTTDSDLLVYSDIFQLLKTSDQDAIRRGMSELKPGERVCFVDHHFGAHGRSIVVSSSPDQSSDYCVALSKLTQTSALAATDRNDRYLREFRNALTHKTLKAALQPIVDTATGQISHHEVLARFPFQGSPVPFIEAAEKSGIISELDCFMVEAAASRLAANKSLDHKLAVNVSGESLQRSDITKLLKQCLNSHNLLPGQIILEITESSQIRDIETASHAVAMLQAEGAKIVLDDFGAGAASFGYLRNLNVDGVKFDGCFLSPTGCGDRNASLLRAIVGMCRELNMSAVGERVETEMDRQLLMDVGVPLAQGYFFGRPQIEEDFFHSTNCEPAAA